MLGLNGKLLDFIYPVGSYYETSDNSFDPNTAWGGTWLEDTKGRVTVALDSEDSDFNVINTTGGSKYLQEHQHKYKNSGGAFVGSINNTWNKLGSNAGGATTNDTSNTTGDVYNKTTGNSGNLQPYIVVKRWHRTA